MEADVVTVTDARQFNYCDLIADIDGYTIQKLIESSLSIYSLSECLAEYYSNGTMYNKRYQYFKSILGFDEWNVISIKKEILKHFNPVLKNFCTAGRQFPSICRCSCYCFSTKYYLLG